MNDILKKSGEKVIKLFPLKNIIVFESRPDFSDNSRAVFDEMIKRRLNEKYQLVWTTHSKSGLPDNLKNVKNVYAANTDSFKYKYYYSYFAKAFVISNYFMQKRREGQYYIYVAHGAAMKKIKDRRYAFDENCKGADFCSYSDFMGFLDTRSLQTDNNEVNIKTTGYARNDDLFRKNIKLKEIFNVDFDKFIYWLPTFRQNEDVSYSSITIPFLNKAEKINTIAKENNILIVIKPHPAQDIKKIKELNLSNILIIDNIFLNKHNIKNYELMGMSEALLSDYSSVFFDYLLCDKPIGLCFEDYEEYEKNEGIVEEIKPLLDGGEKLYTVEDLFGFIKEIANCEDKLKDKRKEVKNIVHKYQDSNSCKRIVDIVTENLD